MGRRLTTAVTLITVVPATTTAADRVTRITATTRAGHTPIGVTEHPRDITPTRIGAVTRTVVTATTTRTTLQRTAITCRWLRPYSGALANSVITTAQSMESSDHEPMTLSPVL